MSTPAAYLRKSKDSATKAEHLALLMAAVHANGHDGDTVVYDDWAKSGDIDKLAKRTEWKRLCDAIEAGDHDVVFMNSLDRGGRSIEEWLRFIRLARSRGVRVIADGVDYSAADNRDRLIFESWSAEKELERAKERSARTKRLREMRGDATLGGHAAPYGSMWVRAGEAGLDGDPRRIVVVDNPDEPVQPLLDAVAETRGNVLQAAKLLNARGTMNRAGRSWDPRALSRALDRAGAHRVRRGPNGGRRVAPNEAPLSRLVQCPCGTLMTPARDPRTKQWASLYCGRGHKLGAKVHGPYVARARFVVDRLREDLAGQEARTFLPSVDPSEVAAKRAALEGKRRKLGIALADDAIGEDDYRERMDDVKRALADLDEGAMDATGPTITLKSRRVEWDADDAAVGEQLRRLVRVVKLGADMKPEAVELRA